MSKKNNYLPEKSEVIAIIAPPNQKYLTFDIMDAVTERFICTMRMPNTPWTKLEDITDYIFQKRPSLKYRKISIEF